MWYNHTMEYYLEVKSNKVLMYSTTQMKLKMLCKGKEASHKRPHNI